MSPPEPTDCQRSGFTKYLIAEGHLTENEVSRYCQEAQKNNLSLLSYLAIHKLIDCKAVAATASI